MVLKTTAELTPEELEQCEAVAQTLHKTLDELASQGVSETAMIEGVANLLQEEAIEALGPREAAEWLRRQAQVSRDEGGVIAAEFFEKLADRTERALQS